MAYYLQFDGTDNSSGDWVSLGTQIDINTGDDFSIVITASIPSSINYWRPLGGDGLVDQAPRVLVFGNGAIRLTNTTGGNLQWATGVDLTTIESLEFRRVSGNLDCIINGVTQSGGFISNTDSFLGFRAIGGNYNTTSAMDWGLYRLKFEVNGILIHDYDPSATGGTGSILPDDVGGNDGTLVSFPTEDSQWVFYSAPSAGVEATGAFTLPLLTASGTASATLPQPVISGAFTLPLLSVAGSATATLPQPIATGAFTVPLLSASGSASASLPQPIASGNVTMPSVLVSGTGSASSTASVATGNITLPLLSVSGTASATLPQPIGVGAFSLPSLTVSGTASAVLPQPVINGNIVLPVLTINGVASVTLPQPVAAGAFNMPVLSVQGFATVSGLDLIIEPKSNIDQPFLSANIKQSFLNANIKQANLSNNITYN